MIRRRNRELPRDSRRFGGNRQESDLVRVTGLFETKKGNLIGSSREEIKLSTGDIIPMGTKFIVVPAKDRQAAYDNVLLVAKTVGEDQSQTEEPRRRPLKTRGFTRRTERDED